MSDFQERLWSELVGEHAFALAYPTAARDRLSPLPILEPPAPTLRWAPARRAYGRRSVRPGGSSLSLRALLRPGGLAATLAAMAAAVTVAAIVSTSGTAPSAAYAITQHTDGTITISLAELTGLAGANEQLARLGAKVKVVPERADCTAPSESLNTPPSLAAKLGHPEGQALAIDPALVPAGDTLVILARQAGSAVYLSFGLYRGAAPVCVAGGDGHVG